MCCARKMSEIGEIIDLSIIRYSRVWEDWTILDEGLQINESDDIISITSSGDNVLNLLLKNPRSITAIDMSPAQNAILELKMAAIVQFEQHSHFLELIGVKSSTNRLELYQALRLPSHVKDFWNQRTHILEEGLCSSGKLDKYFDDYQENQLTSCVSDTQIDLFLNALNIGDQRDAFNELPLVDLQQLLSHVLGRKMMGRSGRDPAQYKYVSTNDEEQLLLDEWHRFCHVCRQIPVWDNIYLDLFLRSSRVKYDDIKHKLPPYLHEQNFLRLKGLVKNVRVVTASIEDYVRECQADAFSKVNLSDIFEYISVSDTHRLFDLIIDKCRKNSRIAYWELFVPRSPSPKLYEGGTLRRREELSRRLHAEDRVFFWSAFNVDEVL